MPKRLTKEEFIKKSQEIHKNKYDYSLVEYVNNKTKVKVICPEHGIFAQTPHSHLRYGCYKCGVENSTNSRYYSTEDFIKKALIVHGNRYDYSKVNYKNNAQDIIIICKIHGEFFQNPHTHLRGYNCQKCASNAPLSRDKFVKKAIKRHNNKYDYSLVKIDNNCKKVKIICPIHGIFMQNAFNHLRGCGCPSCNLSKGENIIKKYLQENNIEFNQQKRFKDCKYKSILPFDFYLPKYKSCIEFDGIQHFKSMKIWGGDSALKNTILRDSIKTEYCKKNNINLLRIKYNEKIEEKLASFLKKIF
jgi:very-short-patch-repair endonuclease